MAFPRSGKNPYSNQIYSATNISGQQTGPTMTLVDSEMDTAIVQVTISAGTATVVVEGRINGDHSWALLDTFSANGASNVARFPEMRARVTASSAANVVVGTSAPCR